MKYIKIPGGQTNVEKTLDITKINPFYFVSSDTPPIILSGTDITFDITMNYTRDVVVELLKYTIVEPASNTQYKWSEIQQQDKLDAYIESPEIIEIVRKRIGHGTTATSINFELKLSEDDIIVDYKYLYKIRVRLFEYETIFKESDYFMLLSRKSV